MNLEMETWASSNLTSNSQLLMKESVICYKVGAYRSAYLMSYLAFKQTIRERVVDAPEYPTVYNNPIEWDRNVLKQLRDDDKWEEMINDIVAANSDQGENGKLASIFQYTNRDRILNRYRYWKDIRNSCAHAKDEHINSSTVEQFWNYIQDDIGEFYVLGGKQYLMNQLVDRYKYYISDEDKNLSWLLLNIKTVYKNELNDFFISFLEIILKEYREIISDMNISFWGQIIDFHDEEISKAFILSLVENKEEFIVFFKYHNKISTLMHKYNSRFIQDYINPTLSERSYYDDSYKKSFWSLFSSALLLKPEGLDIVAITSNYENFKLIKDVDISICEKGLLKQHKVFKQFLLNAGKDLFNNDSNNHWDYYSWASTKNDEYIIECFKHIDWDIELIKRIDSSMEYLKENINSRSNWDSINYGNMRINTFKSIIGNDYERIKLVCEENDVSIEEYTHIKEIITLKQSELGVQLIE
ncbi:MAG TPA: hypothetical protein GX707_16225 [Epulopiscium sp.]|nr:hypothetical protein [Candidatus Epulonipiscium sp.]